MQWNKKGLVFVPDTTSTWAKTHAMIPTPLIVEDQIKMFVGVCDEQMIGRVACVDLDINDPSKVINFSSSPLLDPGIPGTFDENGAVPCSVVNAPNGDIYLYYVGFEKGTKIRYRLLTGLAISKDKGKTFQRYSQAPILDRTDKELFFRCGPCVIYDEGRFKLWYIAGSEWTKLNNTEVPVYVVKYLESDDGIKWGDEGHLCIPISKPEEHGFGRPYVVKESNLYKMFYSIRTRDKGYQLGYAESSNGKNWQRLDEKINLTVSPEGWDSQTVCYSALLNHKNKTYLFYNGNDFGRSGFGYAELIS